MTDATMTAINLVLAIFGVYLCICRMTKMKGSTTKIEMRWQYTIYFTALFATGFSWTYTGNPADWPQIMLTGAIVANLLLGFGAWKHGLPYYALKSDP